MQKYLAIVVGLIIASSVVAGEMKVGVVNMEEVIKQVPPVFSNIEDISGYQGKKSELENKRKHFRGLVERLSSDITTMSNEERQKLEEEIRAEGKKMQVFQNKLREQREHEKGEYMRRVDDAVSQVAKQKELGLVLRTRSVAYVGHKVDITKHVIKELAKSTSR